MMLFMAFVLAQGAATEFDAFFEEFAEKRDNIKTLEAQFEQIVETPDETYGKTGRIAYMNPRQLAFAYDDPPQTLVMMERTIYDYDVEVRQLNIQQVDDLKEAEALFLAFENNPDRLRELYDIEVDNNPDTSVAECASRAIVLKPKPTDESAPLFDQTVLYLREQDFLPCVIHVQAQDTNSYFRINDYKVNHEMAPDALSFTVPEGVSIVLNDILIEVTAEDGTRVPEDLSLEELAKRAQVDMEPQEDVPPLVEAPNAGRGTGRP